MNKKISPERQLVYYIGLALTALGAILFFSVFVTTALHFGDFENIGRNARSGILRAVFGFGFIVLGNIVSSIGAKGVAGSGIVLDPEKARTDLEPFSRMVGGIAKDTLDEADIHLAGKSTEAVVEKVMIKCQSCGKLNEEDAKFCQECGAKF